MAKRRRIIIGASAIDKRLKAGRGQGRGAKYKPWLYIHDVASTGRAWRTKGWKTGRPHHLLSDFEHDYQLIKDWDPSVIDIARNIQKLHKHLTIEDRVALPKATIREAAAVLTSEVMQSTYPLNYVALEIDERLHLQPGTCLTIAYYLMATRQWKIDMFESIQPGNRLILLNETH